ncbi:MAG TPA: thiamine ABC transporter substrate-binding protein, partial [Spirochaetia bacterium]|nr:thiamine ABC transporter substrate-binding protein [Spirochaetia bacterium]
MKKAYVFTLSSCVLLCIFFSPVLHLHGSPSAEREKEAGLVVYAYDSFVSEWGPAGKVIPKFEAKYGIKVRVLSVGDAGQVLNRAILEKDSPKADIILGIDNNMLSRALEEQILQPYRSPNLSLIPEELIFDKSYHVTPFDYGYFAIVYDSQSLPNPPRSLEELTDSRFKKKIILQDPRTSSPGLGFLLWTITVYGDRYLEYWKRLQPSILTITEGWDSAYGMFTNGEAPMVMSYTTSPAYHVEFEQTKRYLALIFEEGNYRQVEGMGILKGARNRDAARKFIDFILTEDFQMEIPLT